MSSGRQPDEQGHSHLLETRQLAPKSEAPYAAPRETGPLDTGLGAPWVVELQIHDTPLTVRLSVNHHIILGRSDVKNNIYPDLDLTPYDGLSKGVSRRHAAVLAEVDRLMIMDMDSTNGTFVNGQRLTPNQPYRLRHGDEIHIGHIRIDVMLVVVPMHQAGLHGQPWVRMAPLPRRGTGQNILLAQQNNEVSEALTAVLGEAGYEVYPVQNQTTAFGAIALLGPDVIVLDMDASAIKGLELCRYVRQMEHSTCTAIIALSNDTNGPAVKEMLAADVDVILGKPVGVDELIRAINSVTQQTAPLETVDPAQFSGSPD